MLSMEDYIVIKTLNQHGVCQKEIPAELEIHLITVSRALKRDGPPKVRRKRRGSKLDPYKPTIDRLPASGKRLRIL